MIKALVLHETLNSTLLLAAEVVCDYLGPLAGRQQAEREALARRGDCHAGLSLPGTYDVLLYSIILSYISLYLIA